MLQAEKALVISLVLLLAGCASTVSEEIEPSGITEWKAPDFWEYCKESGQLTIAALSDSPAPCKLILQKHTTCESQENWSDSINAILREESYFAGPPALLPEFEAGRCADSHKSMIRSFYFAGDYYDSGYDHPVEMWMMEVINERGEARWALGFSLGETSEGNEI